MSRRHRKLTLMPLPAAGLPAADDPGLPELVRLDGQLRPQRWPLPAGSPGRLRTRSAAATDIGRRRGRNEDVYMVDAALGLFVVCDGLGGRPGGAEAAQTAAWTIRDLVRREVATVGSSRDASAVARAGAVVRDAIQGASLAVRDLARAEPHLEGMRTTASVVLIAEDFAVVGQVGDSRVYLGRGTNVRQLTEDHTLHNLQVQRGLVSPDAPRGRNSPITRALGRDEPIEVDVGALPLAAGDRLLLCSDGLHGYLGDEALKELFRLDVRAAAPAAIDYANALGGADNITALFVELVAG